MNVPTWATAIGVLMLLSGGCGFLNGIQKVNAPKALDKSSGMISEISRELDKAIDEKRERELEENSDSTERESRVDSAGTFLEEEGFEVLKDSFDSLLNFSDYYKKWIVRIGYIGMIVSIFYAIAGVLLLMGKPYSIKTTYAAIGLSMGALIFQIVILAMDDESGMIAGMSNIGAYFMIFLNILVLVVLLASDKSSFYQTENKFS